MRLLSKVLKYYLLVVANLSVAALAYASWPLIEYEMSYVPAFFKYWIWLSDLVLLGITNVAVFLKTG